MDISSSDTVTLHPNSTLCCVSYRKRRPNDKGSLNWHENGHDTKFEHIDGKNENEIKELKSDILKNKCTKTTDIFTIPVNEIQDVHLRHYRYVQPVEHFESRDVPIDPYYIGLWLGDGTSRNADITTIEHPIYDFLSEYAKRMGWEAKMKERKDRTTETKSGEFDFTTKISITGESENGFLLSRMKTLGLNGSGCKNIPEIYLKNSVEVRSQVFAGLIDTDGCTDGSKSRYEIVQKNKQLSKDIIQLAKSLGFYSISKEVEKSCTYKGEKRPGKYQRMFFRPNPLTPKIPVILKRKQLTQITGGPKIDKNGNPVDKNYSFKWNDELDNILRDKAKNHKDGGGRIMWKKILKTTPIFIKLKISNDGLRKRYQTIKDSPHPHSDFAFGF